MVKQYPYILEVLYLSGGGLDENGHAIKATEKWVALSRCRDEAGKGQPVTGADGVQYTYQFMAYLPKGGGTVASGTKVRVKDGSIIRGIGEVVYSRVDQLNARIWVG